MTNAVSTVGLSRRGLIGGLAAAPALAAAVPDAPGLKPPEQPPSGPRRS